MPNWCFNKLEIGFYSQTDEAEKQLLKFTSDIERKGQVLNLEEAQAFREKFLEDNLTTHYQDAVDVYILHSNMPIEKFMKEVCFYESNDNNNFSISKSCFSMHSLVPCPMPLLNPILSNYSEVVKNQRETLQKEMVEKYGYHSWYEWRIAHWGVKWDICGEDCKIEKTKNSVEYEFQTPYSSIKNFLETISADYPLLYFSIHYEEEGGYAGDFTIMNSEITDESQYEIPYIDEDED